jgi:uncharacterized cupredoxin-like copper-binding protein
MRRTGVIAVVVVAAAMLSVAPGRSQTERVGGAKRGVLVTRVNVVASEFKFVLNKKKARRGVVIFRVTNTGAVPHNFKIKGRTTRMLSHGQSATLRVVFAKKGHYAYVCTVPGHAAAGMKGVFTIT